MDNLTEKTELEVWTFFKSAFQLGPGYITPMKTKVPAKKVAEIYGIDLYRAWLTETRTVIAVSSGAIVGQTLSEVVADIEEGGKDLCIDQVRQSYVYAKRAELISNERFINAYKLATK